MPTILLISDDVTFRDALRQSIGHQGAGVLAKDHASQRGLVMLVGQRRRLLDYLKRTAPERYKQLIEKLGLRRMLPTTPSVRVSFGHGRRSPVTYGDLYGAQGSRVRAGG